MLPFKRYSSWKILLPRMAAYALAYVLGAEAGHALSMPNCGVATFWPPTGLTVAFLLLNPTADWPLLVLSGMLANTISDTLFHDRSLAVSLGFVVANAAGGLASAGLLRRWRGDTISLRRLRDVVALVLVPALTSPVLSAGIGGATAAQAFDLPLLRTWLAWWASDVMGVLVVTPALIAWWPQGKRDWVWPAFSRILEGVILLVGLIFSLLCLIVDSVHTDLGGTHLAFPLLLWAALRFGPRFVTLTLVIVSLGSVIITIQGSGPFNAPEVGHEERLVALQFFLLIQALSFLTLSAALAERAHGEQALRVSEERFRLLIAHSPTALLLVRDGGTVFGNPAAVALLGVKEVSDLIGLTAGDLIHPEDLPLVRERAARCDQGETVPWNEERIIRADGRTVHVEAVATPVPDPEGKATLVLMKDIEDRKKSERLQQERARRDHLRAAVSAALTSSGTLREILGQVAHELGVGLDAAFLRIWTLDLAGTTLELQASVGLHTHLDGAHARVPVGQKKIGRIAATGTAHLKNDIVHDPEIANREWASAQGLSAFAGFPLMLDHRCVGVIGLFSRQCLQESVLEDLNAVSVGIAQCIERKRAEESLKENERCYRQLTENIQEVFWLFDWEEQRYRYISPAFVRVWGYSVAEVLENPDSWTKAVVEQDRLRVRRSRADIENKGFADEEYQIQRPDGTLRQLRDRCFAIRDGSGRLYRIAGIVEDVTERTRAATEREENARWQRLLVEAAPCGMLVIDSQGRLVLVNAMAEAMFGYSREELLGSSMECPVPEEVRDQHLEDRRHYLADPSTRVMGLRRDLQGVRQNGSRFPIEVGLNPIITEAGTFVVASVQDVSTRREAEQALRRSERLVRDVLDNLIAFVAVTTPEGILLEANQAALQAAELTPESVLGHRFVDTYWWSHSPSIQDQLRTAIDRARVGEGSRFDVQVCLARGRLGTFDFMVSPMRDARGCVTHLIHSGINITERKKAEEAVQDAERRFRNLAMLAPTGIFQTDEIGNCLFVNEHWRELTGMQTDDALGMGWVKALHPEDREMIRETWYATAAVGIPFSAEYRFRTPDGQTKWVSGRAVAMRDGSGHITGYLGSVMDMTTRHETEQQIRAALEEKETLLKEVHHRVKNNLAIIASLLSLQAAKTPDAMAAGILRDCHNRIHSMASIHEWLYQSKDISHIDAALYLDGLCAQIAQSQAQGADKARLQREFTPVLVDLDTAVPLGLIVNELLSNAFKHAFVDRTHGTISVTLAAEEDHLRLCVEDDGVGIPEDFEVKHSRSLGLRLVHNLVRQVRGTLAVNVASGTSFQISIPMPGSEGSHS